MVNFKPHHLTESNFYSDVFLKSHFWQIYCSEMSSSLPLLLASSFHVILSLPVAASVLLCKEHCRNPWICEIALKSWGTVTGGIFLEKDPSDVAWTALTFQEKCIRNSREILKFIRNLTGKASESKFIQMHQRPEPQMQWHLSSPTVLVSITLDVYLAENVPLPANKWSLFHPVLPG